MERMVIPSELESARTVAERVLAEVHRHHYSPESVFAIKLALEEALTNAVKHGNAGDRTKRVTVEFSINAKRAVIIVTDEGPGFDPRCVPDPTADENLECPSGRGIMLMRAYMDAVTFDRTGRSVRLVKLNN